MSQAEFRKGDAGEGVYSRYVNSTEVPDDQMIDTIFNERKTQHADDAVDYESIDELADDEELPEEETTNQLHNGGAGRHPGENDKSLEHEANQQFEDIFGEDDETVDNGLNDGLNNNLFNNLDGGNEIYDDGLKDFDMDGIFDEGQPRRAKKTRSPVDDEIRAKKKKKLQEVVDKLEKRLNRNNLKHYYPDLVPNKPFNFHLYFLPPPKFYKGVPPPIAETDNIKPLIPSKLTLELDTDQRRAFRSKKVTQNRNTPGFPNNFRNKIVSISDNDMDLIEKLEAEGESARSRLKTIEFLNNDGVNDDRFAEFTKDLVLSTTDWNDDKIINAGETEEAQDKVNLDDINLDIDYSEDEDIFNGQISERSLKLDMNDSHLLFVPKRNDNTKSFVPTNDRLLEMKFNISNDKEYEVLKNNYNTKVRSQLTNLNIEHSIPALKLQTPYYKVKLSKNESRAFHRPKFIVRPGTLMSFSRLRNRKKKKDRGKTNQEIFQNSSDLSTSDNAPIIGLEYSEEYPQILSNFGMCSKLINYYRKEKEDDSFRPKTQIGETHVLGVEDRSPFWNFGEVAPGDFVPTLYNNMVRTPIFKHETKNTDFLLVSSQGAGNHQKYYLKSINFMFNVGNIFPAVEVPTPHSRKVTNTSKNRLKMITFRAMNNNRDSRVSVKDISHHFPDQNDMQNRQRLKEFMEYQRHGDDQGYWKIKNSDTVPSEEEIRAMITPEDVCLLDSMQYGQQCLEDTIILFDEALQKGEIKRERKDKKEDREVDGGDKEQSVEREKDREKEKEKEKEKMKEKEKEKAKDKAGEKEKDRVRRPRDMEVKEMDIEEELSPWNLTRNFITAVQTKSMLQLNGEGDPTGIGLGFSFLRATQKCNFHPLFASVKENVPKNNTAAYQQKLYDAELKRIWYSQRSSLADHGPDFNLQLIYDEYKPLNHMEFLKKKISEDDKGGESENKVLRITRRFRDENNILQRRVDTISDPRVIKAYIRRKKQMEDDMLRNAEVDDIIPTNDKELNKLRRRALEEKLASLEKRAKHTRMKKTPKDVLHAAAAAGGTVIDTNTVLLPDGSYAIGGKGIGKGKSRFRRCTACGAIGHIKTKKSCPLYYQTMNISPPSDNATDAHSLSATENQYAAANSPVDRVSSQSP